MSQDIAQICKNGHVITAASFTFSMDKKNYCTECGEKTITNCENCNSIIKGVFHYFGNVDSTNINSYKRPAFCDECGNAYTWTIRLEQEAKQIIDLSEELSDIEKEDFKKNAVDLIRNSSNSKVALIKFKKYLTSISIGTASALRDVLVDIVSESVKKSIWNS